VAFPLEIIDIDPHFPLTRRLVSKTLRTPLGAGVQQVRRAYQRPLYEFTISERDADAAKVRELWGFFAAYLGDEPFALYQSGHEWFDIPTSDPICFGRADGVQTQFYLPNRYIISGTFQTYQSTSRRGGGVADTSPPSLDVITGLVTYSFPPPAGTGGNINYVQAAYHAYYKVVLTDASQDTLLSEVALAQALHSFDGLVLRELP
jgi:hypothetical protein